MQPNTLAQMRGRGSHRPFPKHSPSQKRPPARSPSYDNPLPTRRGNAAMHGISVPHLRTRTRTGNPEDPRAIRWPGELGVDTDVPDNARSELAGEREDSGASASGRRLGRSRQHSEEP